MFKEVCQSFTTFWIVKTSTLDEYRSSSWSNTAFVFVVIINRLTQIFFYILYISLKSSYSFYFYDIFSVKDMNDNDAVTIGPDLNASRSPLDKKLYRQVILKSNGLRCVLVSDVPAMSAAASRGEDLFADSDDDDDDDDDDNSDDDDDDDDNGDESKEEKTERDNKDSEGED